MVRSRALLIDQTGTHLAAYSPILQQWRSLPPPPPGSGGPDEQLVVDHGHLVLWNVFGGVMLRGDSWHRMPKGELVGAIGPIVATPSGLVAAAARDEYGDAPRAGLAYSTMRGWEYHRGPGPPYVPKGSLVAWTGDILIIGAATWTPRSDTWNTMPAPPEDASQLLWAGDRLLAVGSNTMYGLTPRA